MENGKWFWQTLGKLNYVKLKMENGKQKMCLVDIGDIELCQIEDGKC